MKKELLTTSQLDFLNDRGKDEIFASHVYRYASRCMEKQGLFGFQALFMKESATELKHRGKLEDFANNMGCELDMPAIPAVEFKDETPEGILAYLFNIEKKLLEAYEEGCEMDARLKPLILEMIAIQVEGVGEIGDLIAAVESKGVTLVDTDLLKK